MKKFKLGDRVKRRRNIYKVKSSMMYGTVIESYSEPEKVHCDGDLVLGPYSELYGVKWDHGMTYRSYLPHGLNKLLESEDPLYQKNPDATGTLSNLVNKEM